MMKKKIWAALCLAVVAVMFAAPALAKKVPESECSGHSFGGWWTKRSATCTQTGLEFRDCRRCYHWEKREIPKLPHTATEWVVAEEATCTYRGSEEATCTVCNTLLRRFIEMKPHNFGEMEITTEPTCRGEGRGEYVCQDCGKKKRETLPSLGHDWEITSVKKEPTCKAAGSGEKTCKRCGRKQEGTLERLEHAFTEWEIEKMPSGKTKGVRKHTCTLCGLEETSRFYEEGTLYQDMEPCEEVMQLQQMLRDLGYYGGKIRSGTFGGNTGGAVAKFQKQHGMASTEVADPATIAAIQSAWEEKTGMTIDQLVVAPDQ